jgi:hypothetical protein
VLCRCDLGLAIFARWHHDGSSETIDCGPEPRSAQQNAGSRKRKQIRQQPKVRNASSVVVTPFTDIFGFALLLGLAVWLLL